MSKKPQAAFPSMTLRQYAAVAAMKGMLANGDFCDTTGITADERAVQYADDLIAELSKGEEK